MKPSVMGFPDGKSPGILFHSDPLSQLDLQGLDQRFFPSHDEWSISLPLEFELGHETTWGTSLVVQW